MAVNIGSRRVTEKAGLRYARAFHVDWPVSIPGDEHGAVQYAIDRAQWESDRSHAQEPATVLRRRAGKVARFNRARA